MHCRMHCTATTLFLQGEEVFEPAQALFVECFLASVFRCVPRSHYSLSLYPSLTLRTIGTAEGPIKEAVRKGLSSVREGSKFD